MICVYIAQEGFSFFSSNGVNGSKKDDKSFFQKYYLNFENNRFFIKFTILYAIVFLILKLFNEKKEVEDVQNDDEKKNQ